MSSAPEFKPGPVRMVDAQRNEARIFALQIVRDPKYRQLLLAQAQAGMLAPHMETMLWHYAYGKPTERLEVGRIGDTARFEGMSREELAARAQALAAELLAPPVPTEEQTELAVVRTDHVLATKGFTRNVVEFPETDPGAALIALERMRAKADPSIRPDEEVPSEEEGA